MFIGHYGAALAIKSADDSPGLGKLFVAVQWTDVLFTAFVLFGIEKLRIVPGFTASRLRWLSSSIAGKVAGAHGAPVGGAAPS